MSSSPRRGNANPEVKLGENIYAVVPQRRAYLKHKLGPEFDELAKLAIDSDAGAIASIITAVGDGAHRLLKVFIPDLMPQWEWDGYGSAGAAERGEYDETGDRSPDHAQIVTAFEVVMKANRFDVVKGLKSLVDPTLARNYVSAAVAGSLTGSSTSSSPGAEPASPTLPTAEPTGRETPTLA